MSNAKTVLASMVFVSLNHNLAADCHTTKFVGRSSNVIILLLLIISLLHVLGI